MQTSVDLSLTHWGWVTHKCVGNLTIIGSDIGLSPGRRQAIIWTNAGILLIGTLGTNFSEILIRIQTFSYMKMHLKMSSVKWRPFCLGLNVLTNGDQSKMADILQAKNELSFIQVKAWCWLGNKSLVEPTMTKFHDTIWCHKAAMTSLDCVEQYSLEDFDL